MHRIQPQHSPVMSGNARRERESKPGSFAGFLGREERIEDSATIFDWNASTAVSDEDEDGVFVFGVIDFNPFVLVGQRGVEGIVDKIEE